MVRHPRKAISGGKENVLCEYVRSGEEERVTFHCFTR